MDSIIFYPIAFYGFWPNSLLITVILTNYVSKISWEVVGFLKKKELEDYYDTDTSLFYSQLKLKN